LQNYSQIVYFKYMYKFIRLVFNMVGIVVSESNRGRPEKTFCFIPGPIER